MTCSRTRLQSLLECQVTTTSPKGLREGSTASWTDSSSLTGITLEVGQAMGRIHAILSDGTFVTDVEAFRRLYEEVGLGWVYAVTKYEPVVTIANAMYGVLAKYRMQITGRPPLEEIMSSRKQAVRCPCS